MLVLRLLLGYVPARCVATSVFCGHTASRSAVPRSLRSMGVLFASAAAAGAVVALAVVSFASVLRCRCRGGQVGVSLPQDNTAHSDFQLTRPTAGQRRQLGGRSQALGACRRRLASEEEPLAVTPKKSPKSGKNGNRKGTELDDDEQ